MLLVHKDTAMIRYKGDSKAIFDKKNTMIMKTTPKGADLHITEGAILVPYLINMP